MNKNTSNGFTIIELMTVVALVAIVAAIAVPSLNNFVQENKLVGFSNDLIASVAIAKSEAISNRQRATITSTSGGWTEGWRVIVDKNDNGAFTDDEDETVKEVKLGSNLTLKGSPTDLVINANGIINGLSWTGVTICDSRGKGRTISAAGASMTAIDKSPSC